MEKGGKEGKEKQRKKKEKEENSKHICENCCITNEVFNAIVEGLECSCC